MAYGVRFHEIKSHSSFLQNERLGMLFNELDYTSKAMNEGYHQVWVKRCKATLYQIWKNARPLVQSSPFCRARMGLSTKIPGVYTLDVAFKNVEAMLLFCELQGFTLRRNYQIAQHLNNVEVVLRSIMQFFSYFFRLDFKQKPDVIEAAMEFKKTADHLTVQQLMNVVGPKNSVDFTTLNMGGGIDDEKTQVEREDEDDPFELSHDKKKEQEGDEKA
jgi:hypothetical protein